VTFFGLRDGSLATIIFSSGWHGPQLVPARKSCPISSTLPAVPLSIATRMATGSTLVHVSKVLTEFRRKGLINISERSLTMLDPGGFRRVANMR
jgi:hypothetical protein